MLSGLNFVVYQSILHYCNLLYVYSHEYACSYLYMGYVHLLYVHGCDQIQFEIRLTMHVSVNSVSSRAWDLATCALGFTEPLKQFWPDALSSP